MFATKDEIAYAHSILLEGKADFDADKVTIIECDESRDVKACPGSGKTTTLLAKLIILARRMPLSYNQGICVLTHTNVAVNEIKAKLGNKADVLFTYPNHFGTIQSFVDKFLTIPYYSQISDVPLKGINDDIAIPVMLKEFRQKSFEQKKCIYKEIEDKIPVGLSGKEKSNCIARLMFELIQNVWVDYSDKAVFYRNYGEKKAFAKEPSTDRYQLIESVRLKALRQGILKYDDAYALGLAHLDKHPELKHYFSCRFKYLFIDEMQDTNKFQFDIINQLFDEDKTIIQRFGDHHQAIYNALSADNTWIPTDDSLSIDCSSRFGENIAKVLRSVCIEDNSKLRSNAEIHSVKPVLIVYKDPAKVLPEFVRLLKEKEVNGKSVFEIAKEEKAKDFFKRENLKAVGWVGTNREDIITLKSYFKDFDKNVRKKEKVNYGSLKSFLRKKDGAKVRDYADMIIQSVIHLLSLTGSSKNVVNGKLCNYTRTSFIRKYQTVEPEKYSVFRTKLAEWSKGIQESHEAYCRNVFQEIQQFLETDLASIFNYVPSEPAIQSFINSEPTEEEITDEQVKSNNVYEYDGVSVEVGTIHSVKGETHIATLYLETSYHSRCESQRIADQLKGNVYHSVKKAPQTKETLRMVYVGMSRPRYMLCLAIGKSNFTFDCKELRDLWEVVEI